MTNRGAKRREDTEYYGQDRQIVAIKVVTDENDLMIINKSGVTIRLKVADVRVMGRATQGVKLINLGKRNDQISSVCKVQTEEDVPEETDEQETLAEGAEGLTDEVRTDEPSVGEHTEEQSENN